MKRIAVAIVALLLIAFLPLAPAAPGDPCSFLPDKAEQARCRAATAAPGSGAMFTRCADQMVRGVCEQLADPFAGCAELAPGKRAQCVAAIGAETERFALADGRQVDVPRSIVFRVRGYATADPKDLTMCHVAAALCQQDPHSLECLVGRVNWGRTLDWGR